MDEGQRAAVSIVAAGNAERLGFVILARRSQGGREIGGTD
jgi:hypothetical protein